jgi:hypothetical protein
VDLRIGTRSMGAQSKDPEEANTSHTLNTFSSTKAGARVFEVEKIREVWAEYRTSGSFRRKAHYQHFQYYALHQGSFDSTSRKLREMFRSV